MMHGIVIIMKRTMSLYDEDDYMLSCIENTLVILNGISNTKEKLV